MTDRQPGGIVPGQGGTLDVKLYTDTYLKQTFEQAKNHIERMPNNKLAQKNYNELLAEMKRRGFIKYKEV